MQDAVTKPHNYMYNLQMDPAIFLDRDGVIIENRPNYVRTWADVDVYPQALVALQSIYNSPYKIIIVTNQSAVGRGLVQLKTVLTINDRLAETISDAGGRVDGIFICPHAPEDRCSCRKPRPGLLLQAARALSLDLHRSIMIGDAISDLMAGKAAGVPRLGLVQTGRGIQQAKLQEARLAQPYSIYGTLAEALQVFTGPDGASD